jgi:HAE1 family hydrophobic/amphiphilic exporter-1
MHLIEFFIKNPVKVAVAVILLVLFGLLTITPPSLMPSPIRVPVQLTPTIDEPIVSVNTVWEGASPQEVEREIVEPQEEVLKSITGLRKMTSSSDQGSASIILEFVVGTDQNVAKQDTSDALRRVKYQIPLNEFDNPTVQSGRPFGEEAIAWMILSGENTRIQIPELFTFVDEKVKPFLERVEGISSITIFGGREREIQVIVDAWKLARAGITFTELRRALESQNTNVSAGNSAQGKRDIVIRTMGQFASLADVRKTVVKTGPGGPIRVEDLAEVHDNFKKQYGFVRSEGREVIALAAFRETGANVLEVMEGLRGAIKTANADVLSHRNLKLELTQVYDQTTYIHSAIDLVVDNIYWGGLLSVLAIWVFLRSIRGTAVISLAIPICVIGTFLVIPLCGRNVNVVMLAGLAFATGMVVDSATVVLENIYRHLEMGKSRRQASLEGAVEVWGAVLLNSLTTVIVFLPIVFVQEEAGQLFRDIAIAIAGSMLLALLVSISVVPALSARILRPVKNINPENTGRIANLLGQTVAAINRRRLYQLIVVGVTTVGSILLSIKLAPEPSYLPAGNQNLIFGFLITPPGYNTPEFKRIASALEEGDPAKGRVGIRQFWEASIGTPEHTKLLTDWSAMVERDVIPGLDGQIAAQQAVIDDSKSKRADRRKARARQKEIRREIDVWRVPPPPIDNFFFVAFNGICFMGCSSKDPEVVRPLTNVLNSTGMSVPDSFAIFFQTSIFNFGEGNSVDVEIRGDDLPHVVAAARNLMSACMERFGGRPESSPTNFALDRREDRLIPDRVKAGDLGLNVADIGSIVRACGDGRVIGQYREGGKSVDLTIKVAGTEDPLGGKSATDLIAQVPVFTPTGQIVPLSAVCRVEQTTAPQQINHIETQRSVKLTIRPPDGLSLPEVINTLQDDIIAPMRADGYGPANLKIENDVIVGLAGNADKLRATWDSLKWLLALSCLVCYLVMAGLFESFLYPFIIIFTVPFAVVGGFAGLAMLHAWTWHDPTAAVQQMDMLTILGFVILLGTVVNNGVLLVHQALNNIAYGMPVDHAIADSARTRTRPIVITVLTTLTGLIPLVVRPGSGAELYRGLGSVVLAGLACSTVFTLIVIPVVMSLMLGARAHLGRLLFDSRLRRLGGKPATSPHDSESNPAGLQPDLALPERVH